MRVRRVSGEGPFECLGVPHRVIRDDSRLVGCFLEIRYGPIDDPVRHAPQDGCLWPELLVRLDLAFEPGDSLAGASPARGGTVA